MNGRYDVPVPGEPAEGPLMLDVRDALEGAARLHFEPPPDVHGTWERGRRRRARKRAGTAAVAGAAGLGVLAVVWQAGLMGGATGPEPTLAAVPGGYTTFVFGAPDAPEVDPSTVSALAVPTVEDLDGTTWELLDDLYEPDGAAAQVVGEDVGPTTLSFGANRWGVLVDRCGAFAFEGLTIADDGRFTASGRVPADAGCTDAQVAASTFWADAVERGGFVRELGGGDWLLLSLVTPTADGEAEQPPATTVTATTTATATEEPASSSDPDPATSPTTAPTATPTAPPSSPSLPSPTDATGQPPGPTPTGTAAPGTGDILPGFTGPALVTTSPGWPGGGDLFAPTVRAGRNDGFDRVVVDLTGTGTPTWRASYPQVAVRDGSGLPANVAGDAVLEVVITGMAYPEPGDPVYDAGDFGLDTHTLATVVEVIRTTPFEGQLQLFVGMTGEPRPYRVFLLPDPMRLVVDVQSAP